MKGLGDGRRIIPARLVFPCPLEVLRALGYPGDRRVSEFRIHVHAHNISRSQNTAYMCGFYTFLHISLFCDTMGSRACVTVQYGLFTKSTSHEALVDANMYEYQTV